MAEPGLIYDPYYKVVYQGRPDDLIKTFQNQGLIAKPLVDSPEVFSDSMEKALSAGDHVYQRFNNKGQQVVKQFREMADGTLTEWAGAYGAKHPFTFFATAEKIKLQEEKLLDLWLENLDKQTHENYTNNLNEFITLKQHDRDLEKILYGAIADNYVKNLFQPQSQSSGYINYQDGWIRNLNDEMPGYTISIINKVAGGSHAGVSDEVAKYALDGFMETINNQGDRIGGYHENHINDVKTGETKLRNEMSRGFQKENLYLKRDVLQRDDELDNLKS